MLKRWLSVLCAVSLLVGAAGCNPAGKSSKVGVSFGVGAATRWVLERGFMVERAKELGMDLEVRFNTTDQPKTQEEDCRELIDGGIDVLILIPRNANTAKPILDYAKEKKVKVISYARVVLNEDVDLFVGYDSGRIGQNMGQYLTELAYQGDYILLGGDEGDNNATLLYEGAMRYIDPIRDDINVILEAKVPGWSPEEAKKLVKKAVTKNGNRVDAILAPNDAIAGACVEALDELGVTGPVVITGMDAELSAVQRIAQGKQSMTIYMDLKELACTAINQANNMVTRKDVEVNAEFDNGAPAPVKAHLITGKLVTRENLDRVLIDSGYFTHEEVYGS